MSKSTKIIAGLGVAAALGVAALPVASFATSNYGLTTTVNASIEDYLRVYFNGTQHAADASTSSYATQTVNFGTNGIIEAGKSYISSSNTTIRVESNYPGGYSLGVTPTALSATGVTDTFDPAATAFTIASDGADFTGTDSSWGIHIVKAASGVADTASMSGLWWDSTTTAPVAGYLGGTADTSNAIDNVDVDDLGAAVDNTYTVTYGINAKPGMPSGAYTGTATYLVSSDYTPSN